MPSCLYFFLFTYILHVPLWTELFNSHLRKRKIMNNQTVSTQNSLAYFFQKFSSMRIEEFKRFTSDDEEMPRYIASFFCDKCCVLLNSLGMKFPMVLGNSLRQSSIHTTMEQVYDTLVMAKAIFEVVNNYQPPEAYVPELLVMEDYELKYHDYMVRGIAAIDPDYVKIEPLTATRFMQNTGPFKNHYYRVLDVKHSPDNSMLEVTYWSITDDTKTLYVMRDHGNWFKFMQDPENPKNTYTLTDEETLMMTWIDSDHDDRQNEQPIEPLQAEAVPG